MVPDSPVGEEGERGRILERARWASEKSEKVNVNISPHLAAVDKILTCG